MSQYLTPLPAKSAWSKGAAQTVLAPTPRSYSPAPSPSALPAKSAWSKDAPQTALAPTPRSYSPAPSPPAQTHSRLPSALGRGVPIKDGVSIPRGKVGAAAIKQGPVVTFGSIDDTSAPISSSPAAPPPIKSEGVKAFGTVRVKRKISLISFIAPKSRSYAPSKSAILKMFQNPSSAPSNSSPSMRSTSLPSQQPLQQGQSAPTQQSQLGSHRYAVFVPRPQQNSGPGGGPPRSPVYSRQTPNGSGPRSQGGHHSHNGQPSGMTPSPPQIQPQVQLLMPPMPSWPYPSDQHYMPQYNWYPMPSMSPVSSPPSTPSTASLPSTRLNVASNAFVPKGRAKITLRSADGQLENLTKTKTTPSSATTALPLQGSVYRQGSPGTPTRRPTSIRMETEDQRRKRLAEEEREKTRAKAEAEEKVRLEKEEAERKVKEEEERKRKEEEDEKERLRKEEEQ
ncbi:hypothetical protein K443DRAFT_11381, partial [Laccaria amethystina LaAM-08-1]